MTPFVSKLPSCLNVTAHIDHRFGGITTSVPSFCKAIEATGRYTAPRAAFCLKDEMPQTDDEEFLRLPLGRLHWMIPGSGARKRLDEAVREASLVHVHGIWQEHCAATAAAAGRFGKPYVVSAHGMLEPWALRNKQWKKSIYWSWIESANLNGASCMRALTRAEAEHYRMAGLSAPVAVIPNGVSIPDEISDAPFWNRFPSLEGRRVLLFMSRIHYKKGLDILCRAWARVRTEHKDVHLVVAGPDSEGTQQRIEKLVVELGISGSVLFAGMLRGDEKWAALKAAWAFVLPSFSEGFSVAVLEAMGAGVPVLISEQCYFPEVRDHGCGWVIRPDADELEAALRQCLEISVGDRHAMGEHGKILVRDRFCWPMVGRQMADLADWILGGALPGSLEIIAK